MEIGSESRRPLSPLDQRTVVFISHVNPQNNAETAWYGARLTAAGYQVWTSLSMARDGGLGHVGAGVARPSAA
jgi:hypothetical protein